MNFPRKPLLQLSEQACNKAAVGLIWGLPVSIPFLRFFKDSKAERGRLFVRDMSTYTVGLSLVYIVGKLAQKAFEHLDLFQAPHVRNLAAMAMGTTAFVLFSGLGSVALSKRFEQMMAKSALDKNGEGAEKPDTPVGAKKLDITEAEPVEGAKPMVAFRPATLKYAGAPVAMTRKPLAQQAQAFQYRYNPLQPLS